MDPEVWRDSYRSLCRPALEPIMTGFNVNLDRTIGLTGEILTRLLRDPAGLPDLPERLLRSMQNNSADELFVQDRTVFFRFSREYNRYGPLSVGGQAGIAALHLAALRDPEVICIAPCRGAATTRALRAAGVRFIGSRINDRDFIHLVFEHPGTSDAGADGGQRRSRFIVSPVHGPASVLLPESLMQEAEQAVPLVRRLFLSGYQYLESEDEFRIAATQIRRLRARNPALRIHIEWVASRDLDLARRLIRFILPEADSIGMNGEELETLVRNIGTQAGTLPDYGLSQGGIPEKALFLCRKTGLERVHIHTFGYYCLIRRSPADPVTSRTSLLYSSREAVPSAGGKLQLVPEGAGALDAAEARFGSPESPGIYYHGGCCIIIVPSLVDPDLRRTVGTGDRISSAAFATDLFQP